MLKEQLDQFGANAWIIRLSLGKNTSGGCSRSTSDITISLVLIWDSIKIAPRQGLLSHRILEEFRQNQWSEDFITDIIARLLNSGCV